MCRGVARSAESVIVGTMLRTLSHLKNLKGKRVLIRVDFNVPMKAGSVADDTRIRETLPTLKYLLKGKARVIIMTHLGRPDGKVVPGLRLNPIATRLQKLLGKPVKKLNECIGPAIEKEISKMKDGSVVMLENVRFHEEEEACDVGFSKDLAKLGDVYVNDAFGTCHRAHSSTAGVAKYLPSYAGFLVEREVKFLTPLLTKPKKPLTLIVGGAKVDTKIGILKNFLGKANYILIGGALANTFLAAEGFDMGTSLYEKDKLEIARDILLEAQKKRIKVLMPVDAIVADEILENATTLDLPLEDIEGNMKILDIGNITRLNYISIIKKSKTVIWNGPLGLHEAKPFAGGSKAIAKALAASKAATYLGGGDTIDAINRFKISPKKFTFVSTGGGAMLKFMEGKKLPGIQALER